MQKVSDVEKDGNQIINRNAVFSLSIVKSKSGASDTETKSVVPPFLAV